MKKLLLGISAVLVLGAVISSHKSPSPAIITTPPTTDTVAPLTTESAATPTPTAVATPEPISTPVPTLKPAATSAPASNCDPNYSGACVPNVYPSDVDCAGGTGNGPYYVRGPLTVIGTDRYGLDGNNDGVACQ
jgi:hypothetical protein